MLTIRPIQMKVFEADALRRFEDEMVVHLRAFTPRHAEILQEAGLRQVIRYGFARADNYGFTQRGPLRLYVDLIFLLGCAFDTDPQLPWAGKILTDKGTPDPMARAEKLHQRSLEYLDAVAGPQQTHLLAALRKVGQERVDDCKVSDREFPRQMEERLRRVFPQKCAYIGGATVRAVIPLGLTLAEQHAVTSDSGRVLFIGMTFALGHGFPKDPQYPWIEGTLNNPAIPEPNQRAERLHAKSLTYLRHALGEET